MWFHYATISPLVKYILWNNKATFTRLISTGTSINGSITAANAAPDPIPKTAIATAIAAQNCCLQQ